MIDPDDKLRVWLSFNSSTEFRDGKPFTTLTSDIVEINELIEILRGGHEWFGPSLIDAISRADIPICAECQEIVATSDMKADGICTICVEAPGAGLMQ